MVIDSSGSDGRNQTGTMASEELTVEEPAGKHTNAGLSFLRELVFVVVGGVVGVRIDWHNAAASWTMALAE